MAKLVAQSLPIPEIRSSNPVFVKFYLLSTWQNMYWKDLNIVKEANNKRKMEQSTLISVTRLGNKWKLPSGSLNSIWLILGDSRNNNFLK